WLRESDVRAALGKEGGAYSFERPRLCFRDVARNTDERTMIAAVIPHHAVCGNTLIIVENLSPSEALILAAVLNSFAFDFGIRKKVTTHFNIFYVYQMPAPAPRGPTGNRLKELAARLSCTDPAFSELW